MPHAVTVSAHTLFAGAVLAAASAPATAQDHSKMDHSGTGQMQMPTPEAPPTSPQTEAAEPPRMDHSQMGDTDMNHADHDPTAMPLMAVGPENGSGTARLPANEGGMHGLHIPVGDWMLMTHGTASLQYTDVSGPRGDDKLFATSMLMLTGERKTSWGRVQLKSMLSLEPAMDARGYPNLFATGETAGGQPLVDRQHPHDLFMELAARIDFNTSFGSVFLPLTACENPWTT